MDEVQDLGEPRLEFILGLIARAPGFTVFGDPNQLIDGFQHTGTSDVWKAFRSRFSNLHEYHLDRIHRGRLEEMLESSAGTRGPEVLRGAKVMTSLSQAALALRGRGSASSSF